MQSPVNPFLSEFGWPRGLLILATIIFLGATSPMARPAQTELPAERARHILEQRCVVCHGCYDAPCQLKMEAHEGLMRGASKSLVYEASRLVEAPTTRLFDDAHTARQWRKLGFYQVTDSDDPKNGILYRLLQQKQAHPLPAQGPLPEGFDFSLARDQQCPSPEEFDDFQKRYPLWGMPYGLPGLNPEEHQSLVTWLEMGAPAPTKALLTDRERDSMAAWESFLNGDSHKQQLMSRYLYEHLFLASLYLVDGDRPTWFRMVRSSTPPGKPLKLISTRRPYSDPGAGRVYYRLQRMELTPLRKIHMPYRFDQARMDWYAKIFLDPDYRVAELPGYATEQEANPFYVYRDIPIRSRYRFLLEEAQFTIMNFIKGPVCRGPVALNVIEDHFWVMFEDPRLLNEATDQEALERESANLRLPQARTGTAVDIFAWRGYAKGQARFLKAKSEYDAQRLADGTLVLEYGNIWTGDGDNPNAALTIFRHFDTASVVKGFVGGLPKTAWVIDYPLLERIHYLLVAGFDVYGSAAHQLESRLYMDFLRMEGEINFLMYMPDQERERLAKYWYRDARKGVIEHLTQANVATVGATGIQFQSDDPKSEFLQTIAARAHGAKAHRYHYEDAAGAALSESFAALESKPGAHNRFLPSVSFVNVVGDSRDQFYTILRNSGYSNIAQMFFEQERRLPEEDSLTVAKGFIGAYPNQFFQINEKEAALFARDVAALANRADYERLLDRYGVPRNAPWFWRISDKLHRAQASDGPYESGLFDYGRYRGY